MFKLEIGVRELLRDLVSVLDLRKRIKSAGECMNHISKLEDPGLRPRVHSDIE